MSTIFANIIEVRHESFGKLHDIWLASVKATHTFLTDADIVHISPLVLQGLESGKTFGIVDTSHHLRGFINIVASKIEMLFIHPDYFARGYGRKLVRYAEENHAATFVDVNEQNEQAVQFYLHLGFGPVGRSALDSSGAPFPILHLEKHTAGTLQVPRNKKYCSTECL